MRWQTLRSKHNKELSTRIGDFIIDTRFGNPFKGNLYKNYTQWIQYCGMVEVKECYFWLDVVLYLHTKRETELAKQVQNMMIPQEKYPELFKKSPLPTITRTDCLGILENETLLVIYYALEEVLEKVSEVCDNAGVDRPPYYVEWRNVFEITQKLLSLRGAFNE